MYRYIKDSQGLYKSFTKNNEYTWVFLNMDAGTIIYCLVIL